MNPVDPINSLPVNNQPVNQPANNQPANQPANNQPANNQPNNDTPTLDLSDIFPVNNQPVNQPANNQPANQPANNQPNNDEFDDNGKKIMGHVNDVNKKVDDFGNRINEVDQSVDRKIARTTELLNFFQDPKNEAFKPYQNDIAKAAHDRRYIGYKLERLIPFILGTGNMLKIGAKMAEQANSYTNSNGTGGTQNNTKVQNQPAGKDWSAMSDEDFRAHTQKVLSGQTVS